MRVRAFSDWALTCCCMASARRSFCWRSSAPPCCPTQSIWWLMASFPASPSNQWVCPSSSPQNSAFALKVLEVPESKFTFPSIPSAQTGNHEGFCISIQCTFLMSYLLYLPFWKGILLPECRDSDNFSLLWRVLVMFVAIVLFRDVLEGLVLVYGRSWMPSPVKFLSMKAVSAPQWTR